MVQSNKQVNIKLSADTKEAIRSLRELERQVNKLGDLADQGERQQGGFLSSKQVQLYRKILREMGRTKEQHLNALREMEERYNNRYQRQEYQKLKQLEENLKRRQELVRRAEGGNRWGDVASPSVQEYHRMKLEEAQKELEKYKSSPEFKNAEREVQALEAELKVLRQAVNDINNEMQRASTHTNRIDLLHEQDPAMRRYVHGALQSVAATGAIIGFNRYWDYSMAGMDLLRQQEMQSAMITQKLASYDVENQDSVHRESVQPIGERNQYGLMETLQHQTTLLTGGTSGDVSKMNKDLDTVQKFGRAYAVDPNLLASEGALLKKMGTIEDGQMRRFAELIAGAISKGGLRGREEEMIRATTALATSVSQGLTEFTDKSMTSMVNMQTAIAKEIPTLKGERGANLLATMDAAIKNGGNSLDILLGKGTRFTGLEGVYELEKLKEEGIANPRTLQYFLEGLDTHIGPNESARAFAFKENLGVSLHEYEALRDTGILDRVKKGEFDVTNEDLEKLREMGEKDLANQLEKWSTTETRDWRDVEAKAENVQSDHAKLFNDAAIGARGLWHALPDWMQHAILPITGLGVGAVLSWSQGKLLRKGADWLTKKWNPNIGGQGGWKNQIRNWLSNFSNGGNKPPGGGGPTSGFMSRLNNESRLQYADDIAKNGTIKGGFIAGSKILGTSMPIVGGLVSIGLDQALTDNSMGKSVSKATGGTIGSIIGGGLGSILGPAGIIGGAVLGGWLGDTIGGAIYDGISSLGDKESSKDKVPSQDDLYSSEQQPVDRDKVIDKAVEKAVNKAMDKYKGIEDRLSSIETQHTVRIVIDGKIEGMSKDNEDEVKSSIKDYFSGLLASIGEGFDLSFDQRRS